MFVTGKAFKCLVRTSHGLLRQQEENRTVFCLFTEHFQQTTRVSNICLCFKFRLKHTGLKIVTVLMLRHLGFKIRETGEVGQADPVCLV